jgi:hypothetical protein
MRSRRQVTATYPLDARARPTKARQWPGTVSRVGFREVSPAPCCCT